MWNSGSPVYITNSEKVVTTKYIFKIIWASVFNGTNFSSKGLYCKWEQAQEFIEMVQQLKIQAHYSFCNIFFFILL